MPLIDPRKLECREMRESDTQVVLEMLRDGWREAENRLLLFSLTRPASLLLMAVASSGLRFVLGSSAAALLAPVLLSAALFKLVLAARRRSRAWPLLPSSSPSSALPGPPGLLVAVHDSEDVCGCLGLTAGPPGSSCAELSQLAVGRWHRRSGVATFLLERAEERARAGGYTRALARLRVTDRAALALFRKRGYRPAEAGGGGGGRLCCGVTLEYVKDL